MTEGAHVFQTQAAVRTKSTRAHWHWPAPRRPFAPPPGSACGGHRLARESARDPESVPPPDRCQARGCQQHWSTVDQGPDLLSDPEEPQR